MQAEFRYLSQLVANIDVDTNINAEADEHVKEASVRGAKPYGASES